MEEVEKMKSVTRLTNETDLRQVDSLNAAKKLALSFQEPGDRDWALGEIAKGLAALDKWDEAEEIASCITLADEKADTLVAIAKQLAAKHYTERASRNLSAAIDIAKIGETTWVWQRAFSLLGIARALSEINDKKQALSTFEEAVRVASAGQMLPGHEGEECEGVLSGIAVDLATLGHLEKAQTVAEIIRHPVKRQRALETIAAISRSS